MTLPAAPTSAGGTGFSQTILRSLGQSINAGTVYFGFMLQRENTTNRTFSFALFNGTNTERLSVGQFAGSTLSTSGNIGMTITNDVVAPFTGASVAMGTGIAHQFVLRIDFDSGGVDVDRVRLYLNPLTIEEPGTAYVDTTTNVTTISHVRLFAGNTSGSNPGVNGSYDQLKVGTTYGEVVSTIPEPSTAALALLSGTALCCVRRRFTRQ